MGKTRKVVEEESIEESNDTIVEETGDVSISEELKENFEKEGFEIDPKTGEPKIKVEKPKNLATIVLLVLLGILVVLVITIFVLNAVANSIGSGGSCTDNSCTGINYISILVHHL